MEVEQNGVVSGEPLVGGASCKTCVEGNERQINLSLREGLIELYLRGGLLDVSSKSHTG